MVHVAITCPKCKKTHIYRFCFFGKDIFQIGDFVSTSDSTFFHGVLEKCIDCNAIFEVYLLIKERRLINILLNPRHEEVKEIKNLVFKELSNYPLYYKTDFMKECLYGEITNIIPSQFFLNSNIKKGTLLLLFGLKWDIEQEYKVFDEDDNLVSRIYKITSEDFDQRLLVLRNNCLPVLKEIDWGTTAVTTVEEKLKKYVIPKNCELVFSAI